MVTDTFESLDIGKNGRLFPVEVSISKIKIKGKELVFAITKDISQRKKTEEKLIESENTLQSLFAAAPIGICLLKDRAFQWINTKMADILGYTKEELVGQNTRMLYDTEEEYERLVNYYIQKL